MISTLAFFGGQLGPFEIIAICVVALLIFGRRLPEVGRSLGKGIVEFKRGLAGIENDINDAASKQRPKQIDDNASNTATNMDSRVEEKADKPA